MERGPDGQVRRRCVTALDVIRRTKALAVSGWSWCAHQLYFDACFIHLFYHDVSRSKLPSHCESSLMGREENDENRAQTLQSQVYQI
jgi:hypothetical protein